MRKFAAILSLLIAVGLFIYAGSALSDSNTQIYKLVDDASHKASEELKVNIAEIELSNAQKEAELAHLQGKRPVKGAVELAEARLAAHRDAVGYPSSRVEFEQVDNLRSAQAIIWFYGIAGAAFLVAGFAIYPRRRADAAPVAVVS